MAEKKIDASVPLKILILEDNPSDVELLQRELKKSGLFYTAQLTDTRKAFEQSLDEFKPDLILSDYSLPGFEAPEAFQIKRMKNSDAPFILVTGTIGEENAVEMIRSGVTDYVLKDKLFTLSSKITRALKEAEDLRSKKVAEENLKEQNAKLLEIAFLQSHQVRVPVTQIIGLFNLFDFENPQDPNNLALMHNLKTVAESLDKVIHQITEKTSSIEALNDEINR